MSHPKGLCQWIGVVSSWLPNLSWSQAKVLGEYSYGMVMTRRSGLSFIADFMGELKGEATNTVRQRLREWCYDAPDKAGRKRQEVEVTACFAPLLAWIVSWWRSGERRMVLAPDATNWGQIFTVLVISVMYRGCAIPVAWAIVPGTGKRGLEEPLAGLAGYHPSSSSPQVVCLSSDRPGLVCEMAVSGHPNLSLASLYAD